MPEDDFEHGQPGEIWRSFASPGFHLPDPFTMKDQERLRDLSCT